MLTKTNLYSLCTILALLAVALTACAAPGGVINPTPTTEPDQPVSSDTPAPSPAEPTEPTGNVVNGIAVVESIEIRILESFPVQVHVVASGNLPDGCTSIDEVMQIRNGNTFEVTITTIRPADAFCTQALVPFEEVIPLDVVSLPAGTYTVSVNSASSTFTPDIDNILPDTTSAELLANCSTTGTNRLLYVNLADGYCLTYPAQFRIGDVFPGIANLYGPPHDQGPEPLTAAVSITAQGSAASRSLSQVVDEALIGLQNVTRSAAALGGEQAEIVEGIPGRTGSRRIFVVHEDTIYNLSFYPVDPAFPEVEDELTELWGAITESFAFLPEGFAQAYVACPVAGDGTSPYLNLTDGYCLVYPSSFDVAIGNANLPAMTSFIGPAMSEGPEPVRAELSITVQGPADGRTLTQVVDEIVSEFRDLPITSSAASLGGEEAEIVEGLPGITGTRQMFGIHNDTVYSLVLSPVDPALPQVAAEVVAVWRTVTASFVFLP